MKKGASVALMTILLVASVFSEPIKLPAVDYGEMYTGFLLNGGDDLPYKTMISLGVGVVLRRGFFLYGGSIGYGLPFAHESIGKPTYDYPCPHSDYTIIGEYKAGFTVEIFPEIGIRIIEAGMFSFDILAGAGLVAGDMSSTLVGQSAATGWTYDQGYGEGQGILGFDMGGRAVIHVSDLTLSGGYSTKKGVMVLIGIGGESLKMLLKRR